MLAASKQVNLPVFTGKLHVTQVNCARDLFACELHVKLPAFAGNFARASFTVYFNILQQYSICLNSSFTRNPTPFKATLVSPEEFVCTKTFVNCYRLMISMHRTLEVIPLLNFLTHEILFFFQETI